MSNTERYNSNVQLGTFILGVITGAVGAVVYLRNEREIKRSVNDAYGWVEEQIDETRHLPDKAKRMFQRSADQSYDSLSDTADELKGDLRRGRKAVERALDHAHDSLSDKAVAAEKGANSVVDSVKHTAKQLRDDLT